MVSKKSNTAKKQRVVLPILLWLVPLIAVNFGFYFLSGIDLHWREVEQNDMANQEIEALSSASDFSYQFAKISGQFRKTFVSAVDTDLATEKLTTFLLQRAKKIYRNPFPEKDLFAFHLPENEGQCEMLFSDGGKILSKRAFSRIFAYLVRLNRKENIPDYTKKQDEKLLTSILGGESVGSVMATSQRAKTSYALYKSLPNWFIWDYFEIPGKGTYGYMVLSPCQDKNRFEGMLLSLRDFRDRRSGLAAFIPLFRGYGGGVFQSPLNKSRIFRNWISNKITPVEDDLSQWLASGTPPVAELGNFKAFSYLGKGNTHLATLLLPKLRYEKMPIWLYWFNFFSVALISLLLLRGFLLNQWPEISIKYRFLVTFLLAATLPLSLLVISSFSYMSQYRRSIHFQTVSNLLMCIKQFDSRKAQISDEYKANYIQLVKKQELAEALKKEGSFSETAAKIIEDSFLKRPKPLPFMCYAIFDEAAKGIRGYSTSSKPEVDALIDSFAYPIVGYLREIIKSQGVGYKLKEYFPADLQKLAAEAYASVTSRDLIEEVGKRRSYPILRQRGVSISTQMHEYIKIDGREKFAVMIAWEDSALDKQSIKHTSDFLALNNPEFAFIHYKATPQGLEYFENPGRHIPTDVLPHARKLAEAVYFRGSYTSNRTENYSVVAYPSKKYGDMIIVGVSSNFSLEKAIFNRVIVLGFIFLIAVLLVFACAYFAARIILTPITRLKGSLVQVAAGNLDAEIVPSGKDELGSLAVEFSSMAKGLRERNRLASLLSDHAIEALSKGHTVDGSLAGESFDGVAMVSDIRNFTGICEEFSPDIVTELLNEHFAKMASVISEKGGRIYKFIGDAIEAVFPEDPTQEESAELRAFQAASLMNIELIKINRERAQRGLFKYKTGVGLAYGRFFSGGVGSIDTRLDYAVLGDPLQRAAKLEALSIKNPAFPIIVDAKIAETILLSGVTFAGLEGENDAFQISEIGNSEIFKERDPLEQVDAESTNSDSKKMSEVEVQRDLPPWLIFSVCLVLIIALLVGIYSGLDFRSQSSLKASMINATESNLRLIEQLKCENVAKIAFETACNRCIREIESEVSFERNQDEKALISKLVTREIDKFEQTGFKLSKAICFNFGELDKNGNYGGYVDVAVNMGWKDSQVKVLKRFALYKNLFDQKLPRFNLRSGLDVEIPRLIGETNSMTFFYSESFGTAIDVVIDGKQEVLFTRYIIANSNLVKEFDFSSKVSLLQKPTRLANPELEAKFETSQNGRVVRLDREEHPIRTDLYRIVGMVLFSIPVETLRQPITLVNGYSTKNQSIALLDEEKKIFCSANFPPELVKKLTTTNEPFSKLRGVLSQDFLGIGDKKYQVSVFSSLSEENENSGKILFLVLLAIGLFAIWNVLAILKGNSLVNRSLPAKLWLAFLLCSIIPVITVFFVVDLFVTENLSARISQEKSDLQRFLDLFELRQNFSDPLVWKTLKTLSFSQELKQAVKNVDSQQGLNKDYSELDQLFDSWHNRMEVLREKISNFYPRDIAIVSKQGWEYINQGNDVEHYDSELKPAGAGSPDNQFGMLLAKVAKNLLMRMRREGNNQGFNGDSLKGEMTLKVGLQTVRGMFGEDVSVKLANGVGLPVKMGILDSMVGIIIHPVEQIFMPDYIIISMALFMNGGYLDKIASLYQGDYAVFPVETSGYGRLSIPGTTRVDFGLSDIVAWVSTSNLPISSEKMIGGHSFLIESRRGVQQFSMVITGVRSISPIFDSAAATKGGFLKGLLISILFIILLAKNVSAEIIAPVERLSKGMKEITSENFSYRIGISRSDELGDLCNSFDQMARGLEEKYLIGKMLSQNAMESTLVGGVSSKEEVVVFYVGSPGFSSWLSLSSPSELFCDLQKQISEIARIILAEGGDIDKIIGDKILAVFRGDGRAISVSACKAAQKIMNAEQRGILPFPVAAGINKGVVISGVLGVGSKKDFTVIGDAVNVAARIESLAEKMRYQRMLVSTDVFDLLNCEITAREYGTVELKGKSVPMRVFQLDSQ